MSPSKFQVPAQIRDLVVQELTLLGLELGELAEFTGWSEMHVVQSWDAMGGHQAIMAEANDRFIPDSHLNYADAFRSYADGVLDRVIADKDARDIAFYVRRALAFWQEHQWERLMIESGFEMEAPLSEKQIEGLAKRVYDLELSVKSYNGLQNAGIEYTYQLVEKTEAEMLKTKNWGRMRLNEIKEVLTGLGLSLGMNLSAATLARMPGRK